MVLIHASKDVAAALDSVWDVIADIDREPEIGHGIKSIKNISKARKIIEREVLIAFRNSKCREVVKIIRRNNTRTSKRKENHCTQNYKKSYHEN